MEISITNLVDHIVRNLVNKPSVVRVAQVCEGSKIIIEVFVDAQDLKRVIGKEGRIIRTLRSLINCFEPTDKELILDIVP